MAKGKTKTNNNKGTDKRVRPSRPTQVWLTKDTRTPANPKGERGAVATKLAAAA